jgi:hypothetical protein
MSRARDLADFVIGSLTDLSLVNANITTTNTTDLNVVGLTSVSEISETLSNLILVSNSASPNFVDGGLFYISASPTGNFTLDLQNVPTTDSKVLTISFIVVQGSTGYIPSVIRIGGSAQTIKWVGGSAPTPTSSSGKIDIFTFTLIRSSSSWQVLGSSTRNF